MKMHARRAVVASSSLFACLSLAPLGAQIENAQVVLQRSWAIEGQAGVPRGDQTGYSVAWVGDVDGDGFTDLVVGAPGADLAFRDAGTVTLYSGRDGVLLWRNHGEVDDSLGSRLAGAGDVNRDGIPDVIVGAPAADPGPGPTTGSAFVYSGKDGSLLWRFDGSRGGVQVGFTFSSGDRLGASVAGPGDVNLDGYADLLVGAPYAGPARRGLVYLFSGKDGLSIGVIGADQTQYHGSHVAGASDLDLDGIPDLLVGGQSSFGTSSWVYSGSDLSVILELKFARDEHLHHNPRSLAQIGDVNRDGVPDFGAGTSSGRDSFLVAFSGRDGGEILRLGGNRGPFAEWESGLAVDDAGDMDLDGVSDFLVGAARSLNGENIEVGAVYVFSGRTGDELMRLQGENEGDRFGWAVAGEGNADGDLFPDVAVGAPRPLGNEAGHAATYVTRLALAKYGNGVAGSWNLVPTMETGGEIPRLGNSGFRVRIVGTLGGAPVLIAGSRTRANIPLQGLTLHGDFLTGGAFSTWSFIADGLPGLPGFGSAEIPVPIPQDPALLGLRTYWQGFVRDPGSPLPIGVSHTKGLEVRIVR